MGVINKFDISSDFTQFFLVLAILLIVVSVLLTRIAPKGRKRKGGKVDDRFVNREGELIE